MSQSNYQSRQSGRPPQQRQFQQRPPQRPMPPMQGRPAPVPRSRRMLPYGLGRLLFACLIAVALGFVLQAAWPQGFPLNRQPGGAAQEATAIQEIYSSGPIRINEVMSANRNTLSIADGSTPDWVEIINVSESSVDIGGYQMAESANSTTVFVFPKMWLEPGECVLVYCDSRLRDTAGEDLHAPFRLSSARDTLMLFNASDTAVDTLNLPALGRDHSYARMAASQWQESEKPTPGMANSEENYRILTEPEASSPVVINELVSTNRSILADENEQYYDYIELYNRSGETVNLSGWYLSDDTLSSRKWRFPEVSIEPGQYLVVFASKLDRTDAAAQLHTNFSLSSEGEEVVLSNANGRVMDSVKFDLLKADVAWCRQYDGTWMQGSGTPGRAN